MSCACQDQVDDSFDTFRKNTLQGMSAFWDSVKTEYQNFRQKINAEYASFVHTRTDIAGDYILLNGKRFLVCDPTYVGAPIGKTMPEMDNQSAKVILLN